MQARSAASVDAILQATLQGLLHVGKERLTTPIVASRAGVSVGTCINTSPTKSALLQAALKRHLAEVTEAVELVSKAQHGRTLRQMVTALITTFLQAKMREAKTSVARYSVSSDVDGARIAGQMATHIQEAIVRMLATAREPLTTDPQVVGSMLLGVITGVSRRMLESGAPEKQLDPLRRELIIAACAYLDACSAPVTVQRAGAIGGAEEALSGQMPDVERQ